MTATLVAMQLLNLAHITATDIGFTLGLFVLGVLAGAALVSRLRNPTR